MTAAKIDALTACRWPGCTAAVHRRNLCARDCYRVQSLVRDEGAHWTDDPRVWATLWEDRAARVKRERHETGLRNLQAAASSVEASQAAVQRTPAPEQSSAPETPAIVPPKVGDRWGDLTPEQRAMVPVGSVLGGPSDAYIPRVKVTGDPDGYRWAEREGGHPVDRDESLIRDRRITRLGPAPAETPAEPDRSGWPVLVRDVFYDGSPVYVIRVGDTGGPAVWPGAAGEWYSSPNYGAGVKYGTAKEAADAIRARLPDESEAAQNAPQPSPLGEPQARCSTLYGGAACLLCDDRPAPGMRCACGHSRTRLLLEPAEAADIEREAAAGAIAAIVRLGHTEHCAKRLAWGDGECECGAQPAPDPRDAEIAALTRRAEDAEREVTALRAVVREAFEACEAAGVTEGITPAERIAALRERAESAEATLDAYRIQRDQAREDAAGVRRLLSDAADLRAAAAEACDCEDGEVPSDAELARRLRELAREPQDLALVRKVVGVQTAALRTLVGGEDPTFRIAVELAADTIDAVVGVPDAR